MCLWSLSIYSTHSVSAQKLQSDISVVVGEGGCDMVIKLHSIKVCQYLRGNVEQLSPYRFTLYKINLGIIYKYMLLNIRLL